MHTVYFDSPVDDAMRRQRLYSGQLFVFSPRPSTLALCQLAREMIEAAFAPSTQKPRNIRCRLKNMWRSSLR